MTHARLLLLLALRNPVRALVTAASISMALLVFVLLRSVIASWYTVNDESARSDRLVVRHRISVTFPLFTHQLEKLRAVPGVEDVAWFCWFAGIYIDEKNRFGQQAVDVPSYFRIHPEYRIPEDQMRAWLDDATGAAAGRDLAKRHGWKIGDRIPLIGTIYPGTWHFTLRAIYAPTGGVEPNMFFFHWKHLNDRLPGGDHVQRFVVKSSDPSATKAIDTLFAASATPTKTESELSVAKQWTSWSTAVIRGINLVSLLILVVQMLVVGTSIASSTRESTRELATLRAIGYRPAQIHCMVLSQGCFVAVAGIAIALLIAPTVLEEFSRLLESEVGGSWSIDLHWSTVAQAASAGLLVAIVASWLPARAATRMPIAEALKTVN